MKLAVTTYSVEQVSTLLQQGADIIIAGNGAYANRLVHSFSIDELRDITHVVHANNKELYVPVNQMVHNQQLEAIGNYLDELSELNVDGILFGDVSVYQLAKQRNLEHKLIYNPETLNTNQFDSIFWSTQGVQGITVAKEIPLEDIITICDQSPVSVSMIGHGHLNMFHSRRPLVENFFKYKDEAYEEYINNRTLRLVEEVRNESYPIFQDQHGTHIFREKPMQAFNEILQLKSHLDVFIIDGILMDEQTIEIIVGQYNKILVTNDPAIAKSIAEEYQNTHDLGFLYKKTVYVKEKE